MVTKPHLVVSPTTSKEERNLVDRIHKLVLGVGVEPTIDDVESFTFKLPRIKWWRWWESNPRPNMHPQSLFSCLVFKDTLLYLSGLMDYHHFVLLSSLLLVARTNFQFHVASNYLGSKGKFITVYCFDLLKI